MSTLPQVEQSLAAIAELDGDIHAITQVFDQSSADPGALPGELSGVPVLVKDNIATTRGTTSCNSGMLENYESPFDATVVERLREAGAVVIGKANMDEFAMGSSTEHGLRTTNHPTHHHCVPGGSSGGSAAAVGAGMVPLALGSDTGGSIRQPAAFCGCVGLKPTYGRVSRFGLVAFASSLDQIGPLASSVEIASQCLNAIAGPDSKDMTSVRRDPENFARYLSEDTSSLRVGLVTSCLTDDNDERINLAVRNAAKRFERMGATIVEIELPSLHYAISSYYIIAAAEASSNLARFDGVRYGTRPSLEGGESLEDLYERARTEGFGEEVRRRIMLGTYVLSAGYYDAYYTKALRARRKIRNEFDGAFCAHELHTMLLPTTPTPAFERGSIQDPLNMYLQDIYTVPANLAGLPAISVPWIDKETERGGLPVGVQLMSPMFAEARMLQAASVLEKD
ncbi:MAG: Asp-tRNA(Asn)/Glu-tRNA(Gln) amidotransferase subunit GatA [Planctomycetota bacterium]